MTEMQLNPNTIIYDFATDFFNYFLQSSKYDKDLEEMKVLSKEDYFLTTRRFIFL